MNGGGPGAPQPEIHQEQAPEVSDLHAALDRLRARIEEVSAWAESASLSTPTGGGEGEAEAPQVIEETAAQGPLDVLRSMAKSGAVAGGVFSTGNEIIDLTASGDRAQVQESGLVALLNLVPSDTVLEVRTTNSELRAARIGGDAFAVELAQGAEQEVDEWLSSLLPSRKA
ncbi:MAG TPA: hypothetical protein VFZ97_09200 [Acidimicrobiales bacterium]